MPNFFILQILSKKSLFGWWHLSCRAVWSGSHCTAQDGLKFSDFLLQLMLGLQAEARSCPSSSFLQAFFAPTLSTSAEAPALLSSQLAKQIGGVNFLQILSSPWGNSKMELTGCLKALALCDSGSLTAAQQILLPSAQCSPDPKALNKHSKAENNSEHLLHQGFSNKCPLYGTQYGNQIIMQSQVFWWPI